jgi:hypothetical protein
MTRTTTIKAILDTSGNPWTPYVRVGKVEETEGTNGKQYGELWIPADCLTEFGSAATRANQQGDGAQAALDAADANSLWAKRAVWIDATDYYVYGKTGPAAGNIRLVTETGGSERQYQINDSLIRPIFGQAPSHEWLQKIEIISPQILAHKKWHVAVRNHRCGAHTLSP